MNPLPQRPRAHVVGDVAVQSFLASCPAEWILSPVGSATDYGLDVRVELSRDGLVTGEEFAAQIKGKTKVVGDPKAISVRVQGSTINYWLAKLVPTMLVAVDTAEGRIWFGWFDEIYPSFPEPVTSKQKVKLRLKRRVDSSFAEHNTDFLADYYTAARAELVGLNDRLALARLALHVSALARVLTQLHLLLSGARSMEEIDDEFRMLFLEFGVHDAFLSRVWQEDSVWRLPLRTRTVRALKPRIEAYLGESGTFWLREHEVGRGDIRIVPFSYQKLKSHLIPALYTAWDLEEALLHFLTLGDPEHYEKTKELRRP